MELKDTLHGKPVKFLALLLTATLVATVSATAYYSLTMQPKVTVSALLIRFDSAPDEPEGSTVYDAWCRLTAKSYPNTTTIYEKAVYIENLDTGNAHSFGLRHVSITPTNGTSEVGNWTSIRFLIYNSSGYVFSFNYTVSGNNWILEPSSGETSYYSVPQSASWWIRLETRSKEDATVGKVCNIEMYVDVKI